MRDRERKMKRRTETRAGCPPLIQTTGNFFLSPRNGSSRKGGEEDEHRKRKERSDAIIA